MFELQYDSVRYHTCDIFLKELLLTLLPNVVVFVFKQLCFFHTVCYMDLFLGHSFLFWHCITHSKLGACNINE